MRVSCCGGRLQNAKHAAVSSLGNMWTAAEAAHLRSMPA
jgi:hypothetical protein